jgi:hypothetical protein
MASLADLAGKIVLDASFADPSIRSDGEDVIVIRFTDGTEITFGADLDISPSNHWGDRARVICNIRDIL